MPLVYDKIVSSCFRGDPAEFVLRSRWLLLERSRSRDEGPQRREQCRDEQTVDKLPLNNIVTAADDDDDDDHHRNGNDGLKTSSFHGDDPITSLSPET